MQNDNVYDINAKLNSFKGFKFNPVTTLIGLIIFIFFIFNYLIIIVGPGQRVVIFNSVVGVEKRSLGEGLHFLVPFLQNPVKYDVRTHSYTMSQRADEGQYQGDYGIECLTSDGQKVKLDLSVIYNAIPDEVWKLHQQVGPDYLNKIIRPVIRSIARNTIANYPVAQLYSGKRLEVQNEIQDKVKLELAKFFINAPESLIRSVTFSEEFSKAIEQKQVALQEAERMKYILDKERSEKQRKIIEAEGEASAISKKCAALRANPQLIQYEYVAKLAPDVKTIITDQKTIMNLPSELFGHSK